MPDKKLRKTGNSHAIYLPNEYLQDMELQAGDMVSVNYDPITKEIIIKNAKTASSQDARLKRLVRDAVDEYLSKKG